jgi:hypothetical protein
MGKKIGKVKSLTRKRRRDVVRGLGLGPCEGGFKKGVADGEKRWKRD